MKYLLVYFFSICCNDDFATFYKTNTCCLLNDYTCVSILLVCSFLQYYFPTEASWWELWKWKPSTAKYQTHNIMFFLPLVHLSCYVRNCLFRVCYVKAMTLPQLLPVLQSMSGHKCQMEALICAVMPLGRSVFALLFSNIKKRYQKLLSAYL